MDVRTKAIYIARSQSNKCLFAQSTVRNVKVKVTIEKLKQNVVMPFDV